MNFLIVGGGISGILSSMWISQSNNQVLLVENTEFLGGQLRTLSYNYENETYNFDIGPHIPPRGSKAIIWNYLCRDVETINMETPIVVSLLLKKDFELIFPLSISSIPLKKIIEISKIGISYLKSSLFKKKEKNLEDALKNLWGSYFYKKYLKFFMEKYWKDEPFHISNAFKGRVSPPKIKDITKMIIKPILPRRKNKNNTETNITAINNNLIVPKYGFQNVLTPMIKKIEEKGVSINLNTKITKIVKQDDSSLSVEYMSNGNKITDQFDHIIWTGSIKYLIELLNMDIARNLQYRHLLQINYAIRKKDLLGDHIHATYFMNKNTLFHRIYEPKKVDPSMCPPYNTSLCIEITIDDESNEKTKINELILETTSQIREIYNLNEDQIKNLGHIVTKNVYPFLYNNYENDLSNFYDYMKKEYKNISFIGRLGQYHPYNLSRTLNSVRSLMNELSINVKLE